MGKYDRRCATVMNSQHGLIRRSQAVALGLSPRLIDYYVSHGLWRRLHPGVYCDPAAPTTWLQSLMAAVLWAGPKAVASHRAAAVLWELDGFVPGTVEITTSRQLKRRGVAVRRAELAGGDTGVRQGIPTTTIQRTLLDLATILTRARTEEVLDCALSRRLASIDSIWWHLNRLGTRGRAGSLALRGMLIDRMGSNRQAESLSETRFHRLMAQNGMSFVQKQYVVRDNGGFVARLDAAVPELKFGVEILSWRWHSSKEARQKDARRLNQLERLGWTILQFWYEDVTADPQYVVAEVQATLARLGHPRLPTSPLIQRN